MATNDGFEPRLVNLTGAEMEAAITYADSLIKETGAIDGIPIGDTTPAAGTFTTAQALSFVHPSSDVSLVQHYGGNAAGGGDIFLYGANHATQPSEILLRSGGKNRVRIDDTASDGDILFYANDGSTVGVTIDGVTGKIIGDGSALTGLNVTTFKNKIINGDMSVAKRGTSFTPLANAYTYTLDRWATWRGTNANYTVAQQGDAATGYSLRYQRDSGTSDTDTARLYYIMESPEAGSLAGKEITFSFEAKAGADFSDTELGILLTTGTTADEGLSDYGAGTWAGKVNVLNTSQALTTGFVKYEYTMTLGATVKELGLRWDFVPTGTAGANDWFEIKNIQVEEAPAATVFEKLHKSLNELLCARYFYRTGDANVTAYPMAFGNMVSSTQARFCVITPVPMFIKPIITGGTDTVIVNGASVAVSSFSNVFLNGSTTVFYAITASATATNPAILINAAGDLQFDGEIY